jgi:hypothetical protein
VHLELILPPDTDPYERPYPDHPAAINTNKDLWQVNRLLDKQISKKKQGFMT